MQNIENMENLLEAVRDIAYGVHVYLGSGYLEKVYENCLRHRLEKANFKVESQKTLKVYDEDGYELGDYFADLVVNDCLIVELKAVKSIAPEHLAQTINYLKATGYPLGLLINFGSYKFETRKVYPPVANSPCSSRSPRPTHNATSPCSLCSPWPNNLILAPNLSKLFTFSAAK